MHTFSHTLLCVHTPTYTYTYTTRTHVPIYSYTYTHLHLHTHLHEHIHTFILYISVYLYKYIRIYYSKSLCKYRSHLCVCIYSLTRHNLQALSYSPIYTHTHRHSTLYTVHHVLYIYYLASLFSEYFFKSTCMGSNVIYIYPYTHILCVQVQAALLMSVWAGLPKSVLYKQMNVNTCVTSHRVAYLMV